MERVQCTTEEDGDSVDSTVFDFDVLGTEEVSEGEAEDRYDHILDRSTCFTLNAADLTYDHAN